MTMLIIKLYHGISLCYNLRIQFTQASNAYSKVDEAIDLTLKVQVADERTITLIKGQTTGALYVSAKNAKVVPLYRKWIKKRKSPLFVRYLSSSSIKND